MKTYEVLLVHRDYPKELPGIPTMRAVVHARTPPDALNAVVHAAGEKTEEPYFVCGVVLGLGHLEKVAAPFGVTVVLFEPKVRVGSLAVIEKPEGAPARRSSDHYRVKLG